MAQVKHNFGSAQKVAATRGRDFHTFLLMAQFEAREIGARISRARDERGMTQEELAAIAPFSKRSLQDYEAGKTIPYRHLQDIGKLLGRPTEWFLNGEPEQPFDAAEFRELREEVRRGFDDVTKRLDDQAALLRQLQLDRVKT